MSAHRSSAAPVSATPAPSFRPTALTRANPVAKIVAMFAITCGVLFSVDLVSSTFTLFILCLVFPLTGISLKRALRTLWWAPLAALTTAWATVLMSPASGAVLVDFGPLFITTQPALAGLALFVRSLDMMVPCVLLAMSIDSTELADSLVQIARLPERFVLATLAATRLMGVLAQDLQTLQYARRTRGVARSGFCGRIADFFPISAALLIEAVRKATRLAMALEGRAFGAPGRTWSRTVRLQGRDYVVMGMSVLIATVAIGLAIATGHWNFLIN